MSMASVFTQRIEVRLVVAFVDLTLFTRTAMATADAEVASVIDGFYELVGARITRAGGAVVKFIGDAALIVFTADEVEAAIEALLGLADEADAYFEAHDWPCRLQAKVHLAPVIAGPFGAAGDKRFDVIGSAVNTAARLPGKRMAVTAEVRNALSPSMRARISA